MSPTRLRLVVSIAMLVSVGACDGATSGQPESTTAETPYDRKTWKHWTDEDGDCQDTRVEVLIAEAIGPVEFESPRSCDVATGRWQCPYTGEIIRDVHRLDVDHMVPLGNAHRSGGASWDAGRRQAYANDLEHEEHLIAVDYSANRSKGDKGPEAWLPPAEEARCNYVRDWVAIKTRWDLSMTTAEAAAVEADLALCDAGEIPPLPERPERPEPATAPKQAPPTTTTTKQDKAPRTTPKHEAPKPEPEPEPDGECCRVCKKGKACGDGCISEEAECTKPAGCACDD